MDTKWRERVVEVFGKREEDFADAGAFNDYVEQREDISTCVVYIVWPRSWSWKGCGL